MISFSVLKADFQLSNPGEKKEWLKNTILAEKKITGEIHFIFCDDKYLAQVNLKYLSHDTLTDIITFSNSENPIIISGDIFISVDRVFDNARTLNNEFEAELSRVIVHGVLHLLGYNDHTPDEKLQMRAKEDYYLHLQP
ncbi:MAG: rRNA maturation RNase YbeY [Bacteroidetes bacterium]|nr:MAG: rRNA maturation RNase YbeY [Bacteroidota bacterium]